MKYWENKITVPSPAISPSRSSSPTLVPLPSTPIQTPIHSTTPSELEYELRESVAMSSILINIVDIAGSGVNPDGKSHEAWKLLQKQYGAASDRARNMREKALALCKFEDGMKVAGDGGHIENMRTLRKSANDAGADITDERFITKLLDSFPESWDAVISNLYEKKDLSEVIMKLTTHGERLANRLAENSRPGAAIDSVKALETTVLALQAELCNLRRPGGSSNPNKSHLICSNTSCGKTGHLIEDCFQIGGGKQGQYPTWWKGKRNAPPSANFTSSTTEGAVQPGRHFALSATIMSGDIANLLRTNQPSIDKVALAVADIPASMSSCSFADSGCTTHFFKSRDVFTAYKPLDKVVGQSSKEGASFCILGTGNVELRVVFNGSEHILTFKDALHAPDITANLLSISKMDIAG